MTHTPKPETIEDRTAQEVDPATPCSSLDVASAIIRQHEYLLNQQEKLMQAVMKRNRELVEAANQCHRENHKLRKELDGYKRGRLWTALTSILPTLEMRFRDE